MTEKLVLPTLLGNYPGTKALRSGQIGSPLFDLQIADYKVSNRAFPRVVREHAFQVAELALVTFFQAKAYGKPLVLLPAVIGAGRFQHHCLVYNAERGRVTVDNLAGKRVGIRSHAQTTIAWVRGILARDYGVDLDKVKWVTFEDAHVAEFKDPPEVERAPEGKPLLAMLLDGDIDAAVIGTDMPDDPRLQPVIPNPHEAARQWSARNGAISINHMMAVDATLSRERPDVVDSLYRLLLESKRIADEPKVDGIDLTPFGVEANRRSLALLLDYTYDQGLLPQRLSVDDLFDETTRKL